MGYSLWKYEAQELLDPSLGNMYKAWYAVLSPQPWNRCIPQLEDKTYTWEDDLADPRTQDVPPRAPVSFNAKNYYHKEYVDVSDRLGYSNSADEEVQKHNNWIVEDIELDLTLARDPASGAGLDSSRPKKVSK